ncbi:condensation domain-containing protein [Corynebacterium terpenotabidum]|uniref:Non-ribosomal peptide synthetase n=1 Tax=Corynebacterium terpenotabidum Y-11 TaxID=1200352 RepID=S4XLW0_9CORY|nr:condensation domain-containing protein [Corynebacterium terpenotabidum]AGP31598.1 non-ribosomal peptide synthetase [Corynebacterium terpenotabidum Y-11]
MTLLELGAAQRGIWNAQLLDPTSPYYVVGEVLELEGPVDVHLLAEAVRRTVDESDTLRLRFTDTEDGPRQWVEETPASQPEIRDLSGAPDPRLLASAVIDAEKADCGQRWRTMTDGDLHRYLILDLGDAVWCVQLYHHLIVDGYSAALLTRRTAAHYTELSGGRPARRSKAASVAEIVDADLAYAAESRDADREFWHDLLTPAPDVTGREDHVHGAGTTAITTTLRLTAAEMADLRARAEDHGLVWSDLVIAAYVAWLRKSGHTRDDEAVLAMPMMARTSGLLLRTPAMLVNMLPVRIPVPGTATLPEVAAGAHAALDMVRPHQRYPGSALARDLGSPAVLHGIGLNLKTFDFSLDFNGTVGVLRNVAGGPPEDLVLVVTPAADGGTDLAFETDPASVDAATAHQRLSDIRALLTAECPLSEVRLRSDEEAAALRHSTALSGPVPTLDDLIDSLHSRDSWENEETPLLVSADATVALTAAEIHARLTTLAGTLAGVGADGSVIALDLPKSPDLAVAVLATWRARRAFVILDRDHPEARRAQILADSGAVAVVDEAGLHPTDGSADGSTDTTDTADLAYLLYTSGTTGTPKGVEITRGAVEALLAGHAATLWPDAWSRSTDGRLHVAHTASFSFDAALDQLAWIFTGATVHLYDHATVGDPEAMHTALHRDRISVLDATPSLAGALIDGGVLDPASGTVSTVILGGEALPQTLWDRLADASAEGTLGAWNVYGPTETTVDALTARITPGPVSIGAAVPGMTAEILDIDGEPVPDNEVGELYLSGPQVALGYRGRADQTAASFDTVDGVRRYRTGDLVRWVPGRGAAFLGRADDQLEIRGHRVEPGEVEAALLALPEVTGAVVGTFGTPGALKLIAHVTLTAEAAARVPGVDVRAAVAETVPGHLVPTRVRVHDRLPLTVGGKVDRQALATLVPDATDATDAAPATAALRSEAELVLADVLAGILGLDGGAAVALDRDFISLGGDSIGALTAAGQLRHRGYGIQAKDLLSGADLADVAAAAERVTVGPSGPVTTPGPGSADATATVYATGAIPVTPVPATACLSGTLSGINPDLTRSDLLTAVRTMMTVHGALRGVLDLTGPAPRVIVPRTPLVDAAAVLDSAAPDPQRGLMWTLSAPDESGCVHVTVHRSVLDPEAGPVFLAELGRALAGVPLRPAAGSWRACATAPDAGSLVEVAASDPQVVTLPDPDALLTVLPRLFRTTGSTVLTALAALAADGPVGLRHRPGTTVLGNLARTTTVTATGDARHVLLQVKEDLRGGGTVSAPVLTVGCATADLLPTGPTLLTGGVPHLLVDPATGTARLYHGTGELADRLTAAAVDLAVLARTGDGGASPGDLHVSVTQEQIDAWEATTGPLSDVLPVAPLQEGLLYHALAGGDGYVLSAGIDLCGDVDADRLHTAFRDVLARHDLLRARFDAESLDEPVQLIPRAVHLPWRTVDLSHLPTEAATAAADDRLRTMAARQIDLATGPLVAAELVLLPAGDGPSARLILGNHHLLTDGWSTPVMIRDLLALYHGEPLADAAPYSDFLDWLADREVSGAADADDAAWRDRLDGLSGGTLLRDLAPSPTPDLPVTRETVAELTVPDILASRAREAGVTVNTLLQVAWSLTLAGLTGGRDIVTGTTVSGRPTELPGIDRTVGLFINTLPARVTLDPAQRLTGLLQQTGRTQARMTAHESTPLPRVEQLAGVGPLFDTLVVVDNFPSLPPTAHTPGRIGVAEVHVDGMTSFPLSCVSPPTAPGEPVRVVLAHRPDLVDARFVDLAATTLTRVLEAFAGDPTVGEVLAGLPRWTRLAETPVGVPAAAQAAPAASDAVSDAASDAGSDLDPAEVTATVAEVMAALLKKDHVGDHDNFFDIGGHSLLAMRLLGRLRRAGLTDVTIQDIVETGSPAALAARLAGGGSSQILPLGPGSQAPLFAVHPGGGFALPFRGLADRLAAHDIPVTGLQLPDPHPDADSLTDLAVTYVDAVQAVQPQGPYRLAGYSFGGTLVQAMTAELLRRGDEVSYLAVLDAYPAGAGPRPDSPADPDDTPDLTPTQIAAIAGVPDLDDLPGGAEAAEMVARTLGDNLRYCDSLLRTAAPVDLTGFTGTTQLIVATRADERVAAVAGHLADWDPAAAWNSVLADAGATDARTLTLDLTHAGLATATGWDAVAPTILEGLQ